MKSARFHGISEVVFKLGEDLGNQVSGENEPRFATDWASHFGERRLLRTERMRIIAALMELWMSVATLNT